MQDRTSNFYKARRARGFGPSMTIFVMYLCPVFFTAPHTPKFHGKSSKNIYFSQKFCKKKFFSKFFNYNFFSMAAKKWVFLLPKCSESSPNIRTELRTPPNITFLPKTELRTSRTSQKTEQFANTGQFVPPLVFIQLFFLFGFT